mgnify:FL=1
MSGTRTIHVGIDLKGVLSHWTPREWVNVVAGPDGRHLTPNEVRDYFLDQLSKGRLRHPFGEPCEGWSWTEGCPGHPTKHADDERSPHSGGPA